MPPVGQFPSGGESRRSSVTGPPAPLQANGRAKGTKRSAVTASVPIAPSSNISSRASPAPGQPGAVSGLPIKKRAKGGVSVGGNFGLGGVSSTVSNTVSPTISAAAVAGQNQSTLSRSDTIEELEWIDRCKRTIGNKATYTEFLKVLNLFSQEIIDAKTLVERVEPFLSRGPELFDWFKKFVKYEEDLVIRKFIFGMFFLLIISFFQIIFPPIALILILRLVNAWDIVTAYSQRMYVT
jgi:histone deacetylase complex regulatory component SIN3